MRVPAHVLHLAPCVIPKGPLSQLHKTQNKSIEIKKINDQSHNPMMQQMDSKLKDMAKTNTAQIDQISRLEKEKKSMMSDRAKWDQEKSFLTSARDDAV